MLQSELASLLKAQSRSPLADLTYLRPVQVPLRYPFSRALVYQLLSSGDIKSILVHKPGSIRGIRLVSVASIENFLAKLAREQQGEGFTRAVAKEYNTGRKPLGSSDDTGLAQEPRRGRPRKAVGAQTEKTAKNRGRPRKEAVAA